MGSSLECGLPRPSKRKTGVCTSAKYVSYNEGVSDRVIVGRQYAERRICGAVNLV